MSARVFLLIMALVAGCSREAGWQSTDISGLMPPLAFELQRAGGKALTADDLKGKVVLLTFGYASCPDVCPTTLARLANLIQQLSPAQAERVRVVFVSVDPKRDTPERLAAFVGYFDAGILGVTGTRERLEALARRYRTTFSYGAPTADGFYEVTHSSGVYVFDRDGEARLLFRPGDSIDAMATDLKRLLD